MELPVPIPVPGPVPVSIDSSALYSYGLGYAPNGAIVSSQDSVNGNWSYSYDPLDRLAVAAGRANFSYDYDRNGNRWRQNSLDGQGPSRQYGIDASNNRLSGMAYDALGNVVHDGTHSYTYDAENRLIKVDNGATARYDYDAFGRRARKSTNAGATHYVFDQAGRPVAAKDDFTGLWLSAEVYAGGRHLATYARNNTYLHHQDWLGSNRLTTLFDGTPTEMCQELPFGDALSCSQGTGHPPTATPFADYERDPETQLDHTWFRQYSSVQGRWTTPDPFRGSIDPSNPQSLNRYSYVLNDPVRLRDPLGLMAYMGCVWDDGTFDDAPEDGGATEEECADQEGTWKMIDTGNSIDVIGQYPRVDPVPPSWDGPIFPINPYTGVQGPWRVPFPTQKQQTKPCSIKPTATPRLDPFDLSHLTLQSLMTPRPPQPPTISAVHKAGENQPWYAKLAQIPGCIASKWLPVRFTGRDGETLVAPGCDEIERSPHAEYGAEPPRGPESINDVTPEPCPVPY